MILVFIKFYQCYKNNCINFHFLKDFGVDCLIDLIKETNFPWLISNVFDVHTKKPLALAKSKSIIEFNGIKVGADSIDPTKFTYIFSNFYLKIQR